jgi:hypothetical protein
MLAPGVLSGLLAAAVALGVAELIAGITGPQGSPVVAVGGAAIDMTPIPVKDGPAMAGRARPRTGGASWRSAPGPRWSRRRAAESAASCCAGST